MLARSPHFAAKFVFLEVKTKKSAGFWVWRAMLSCFSWHLTHKGSLNRCSIVLLVPFISLTFSD